MKQVDQNSAPCCYKPKKSIMVFLLVLFISFNVHADWVVMGTAGFSNGSIQYPSLAINNSGTVYVAYQDLDLGGKCFVKKFENGNWVNVGGPNGISSGWADNVRLDIDPGGVPYVAFTDYDQGTRASVLKYNGSSWEYVGSAGFSDEETGYLDMEINSSGQPYLAYIKRTDNKLKVVMFDGTNWVTVGLPDISAGNADSPALVIDGSDNPLVMYRDAGYFYGVCVKKFNGTSWGFVGSPGPMSPYYSDVGDLTVDASGIPYGWYIDPDNSYKATVKKFTGTWDIVGTPGQPPGSGNVSVSAKNNILINNSGMPVMALTDGSLGGKAHVIIYNGTSWEDLGTPGFSDGAAERIQLEMDIYGNYIVAFVDNAKEHKITVMGYYTKPLCPLTTYPADNATSVPLNATLNWEEGISNDGYYLYLGTDNPPTNIENGTDLGNVTSYELSGLDYDTKTYYWQVVPYIGAEQAEDCQIRSFTTGLTYIPLKNWSIFLGLALVAIFIVVLRRKV